jgi:O-antigen ligase
MLKLTKLEFVVTLTFLLLILGQLVNLKFYGLSNTSIYFFDLYILVLSLVSAIYMVANFKQIVIGSTTFLFLLFTVVAGLSLIANNIVHNYSDFALQAFYLIRWASYLISAACLGQLIRLRKLSLPFIYKIILLSAVFLVLVGFIQLYLLPDFTVLDPIFGWDPHKGRLASTFFDPNFAAAYIVVALCLCLGLFYYQRYDVFNKRLLRLIFVILCLGLFFTFSRSGWGMFVIVMAIFGILKYRMLLVYSALVALLAYAAIPRVQTRLSGITDPSDSAHFRLISWSNALEVYKTSPLTGVGFNAFREAQKELDYIAPGSDGGNAGAGTDSSMLFVLATTGVAGFFLFNLGYLIAVLKNLGSWRTGGLIPFAVLVALLFESSFINSLFYPQIMFVWLILVQVEMA